jgi:uncharacterized protein (DUF488 family)
MPATRASSAPPSHRQRMLLRLLGGLGGSARNLDFQKVLFLFCQEARAEKLYDFVPYRYGAFSFTSYADRRKLTAHGLIQDNESVWQFTEDGKDAAQGEPNVLIAEFVQRLGGLRGDALVAETYRRFPYYATRSEIADRVLRGESEALARIGDAREQSAKQALFTIGYEGHSLESYLNTLIGAGVSLLCDVRRNPISRKYGFSKSTLSGACVGLGIRYEHLPELGIASAQRQELRTQEDYDVLFRLYEENWSPNQALALTVIRTWVEAGERVALTCYEHLPCQCHRRCVAEQLEGRFGAKFLPGHL